MIKRFLRHVPIIHHHVMAQNEELLKELSNKHQVHFKYTDDDEAIILTFPNKEELDEVVLFDTDYQYKCLDRVLISKLLTKEIDRLTMLSTFNESIPNLPELIELNKKIGGTR